MSDVGALIDEGPVALAAAVRAGKVRATDATQECLDRIDAGDGAIGAFVSVDAERALADAAEVDRRIAAGDDVGPLAGVPLGVKDLEDAIGLRTTKGSLVHADDPPATTDSNLVARLRAAGCVVVGKTNTPEGGWTANTFNRVAPPTRNPFALDRAPGGSSGGSAAAVAAGFVPLATASDGGGSIRIPAAVCGLPGFKPSLGRVAGTGALPPTWADLSTSGVLTRRLHDAVVALDCAVGPEPVDLRALPMPTEPWSQSLAELGVPHRVAWSPDLGYARVDADVAAACRGAVDRLADLGCEIVEVPAVFDEDPVVDWLILTGVSDWASVAHLHGTERWDLLDPGRAAGAERSGRSVDARRYVQAEQACHVLNRRLVEVLRGASVLLCPTTSGRPPRAGAHTEGTVDGEVALNWVGLTYPFNLTRSPAGSVPVGLDREGVPIGLQVVGPQHGDVAVLRTTALLESVLPPAPRPTI